jgi:glycosyltransferase involved in cell wall biosynthesis
MIEKNRLVSVLIPVYNGDRYLAEAIESVLAQSYRPIEIVVVDDGSTDGSGTIARRYESVRYFFQPNSGLSAALNSGVKLANGDFLAFLDADDLWEGDKLARQMDAFDKGPSLDIVFGHFRSFYSPELGGTGQSITPATHEILPGYFKGTMLIRRGSFWKVGLFDTRWRLGDFMDWYKRATEQGLRMLMLRDVVLKRRVHGDNRSYRQRHARTDYVRILKEALDRQRQRKSAGNTAVPSLDDHQDAP